MSETSEITKPIIDALNASGIMCMRLNSGKVRVRGGWMNLCPEGTADIVVYPLDYFRIYQVVWLETKTLTGKHREAQLRFKERVEGLGHLYLTIRDPKEIDQYLEAWR